MEEVPSIKILFSQTHSAKFVALSRDHRTLFWWIIKNYQINPACLCGIAPVLSWPPTSKQAPRSLFSHFGNIHNNYPGLGVWGHWASGTVNCLGPLGSRSSVRTKKFMCAKFYFHESRVDSVLYSRRIYAIAFTMTRQGRLLIFFFATVCAKRKWRQKM